MQIPRAVRAPLGEARRAVNRRRHEVVRVLGETADGAHLVRSPVFVLSSTRSGSTLLRSVLNAHRAVCAPHELHLAQLRVKTDKEYAVRAWEALGLSTDDLADVLWDRALHLNLVRSGKRIIVDKTPQNVLVWRRIHAFWPEARYLHLRRHPGVILDSMRRARPDRPDTKHVSSVLRYADALDEARQALPGPTVRYETLTVEPERVLREVCDYLGVRYQAGMLRYRSNFSRAGLGDWSENIRSGRIKPHGPLPALEDVPEPLHDLVRRWGY